MKIFITLLVFTLAVFASNEFKGCDKVIDKQVYKVCYSYKYKGALFVSYTLNGALVNVTNIKKRPSFYSEKNIPIQYRSKSKDYFKSGFDKGHLLSDASIDYDKKILKKAYSMANIIPQYPSINRYTWIKTEKLERKLAVKLKTIKVLIGIIYEDNPQRIGKNKIAVPKAYYKKLYNDDVGYKKCFYYINSIDVVTKGDRLIHHLVDCKSIYTLSNTHTQNTKDTYTKKQKQGKNYTQINKKIKDEDTHKKYDCTKKVYCSTIKSCDEAMYYLNVCNLKRLDRDKDNIPCEKLCK